MQFNLADLFDLCTETVPDRMALAHGPAGVTRTWGEFGARTNALARHLQRTHEAGSKLAIYSFNRPEFVEGLDVQRHLGVVGFELALDDRPPVDRPEGPAGGAEGVGDLFDQGRGGGWIGHCGH